MPSVPQLLEEDVREIEAVLKDFVEKSEATAAFVAAEGGCILFQAGNTEGFNSTSLGALAAGSFVATQEIARTLAEASFASVYQQGLHTSILIGQINLQHMLVVVFPSSVGVGAVKYFAAFAIQGIAAQFAKAQERAPDAGVDFTMLNIADGTSFFRRKASEPDPN